MLAIQVAVLALAAGNGQIELLDFYADWCGPCKRMESTVHQLAESGYPVRKVNIDQNRKLAARHHVQAIPCFVLCADGEEIDRIEGPCSANELKRMFDKAQSSGKVRPSATERPSLAGARPTVMPAVHSGDPLTTVASNRQRGEESIGNVPPADLLQRLMAGSVRLKIEDPQGHSFGSGTIIDAREGEALILTCGHVFRDSKGNGKISVDLFAPGAPQGLPGELIDYDLKSDVGLVAVRVSGPVTVIPVAPPGHTVKPADKVVSIGCDNGNSPSARQSHVTGLNKFLGAPNLQVAGQPVTGRSGGGLFSADGYVIGVCNAADPTDNEGLFAALAAIHSELDKAKLADVYQQPRDSLASSKGRDSSRDRLAAAAAPQDPFAVTLAGAGGKDTASAEAHGILRPSKAAGGRGRATLSAQEEAVLSELQTRGAGAEVICIIRPLNDPRAQSEIIVLDKASPDFLEKLASEQDVQDARHLTSHEVPTRPRGTARRPSASRTATAPSTRDTVSPRQR